MAADIAKYYQGTNLATPERVRLLRLAWDLVGTQFGSRQTLYQRQFNGDVVQLRMRRYAQYDYSRPEEPVRSFMLGVCGESVDQPLAEKVLDAVQEAAAGAAALHETGPLLLGRPGPAQVAGAFLHQVEDTVLFPLSSQ